MLPQIDNSLKFYITHVTSREDGYCAYKRRGQIASKDMELHLSDQLKPTVGDKDLEEVRPCR